MLEAQPNNASSPVRKEARQNLTGEPWTDQELALLRSIADECCSRVRFAKLFPNRTFIACKTRMTKVRKDLKLEGVALKRSTTRRYRGGEGPVSLDPDEPGDEDYMGPLWERKAIRSNAEFLAALQRAGFYQPAHA